MALRTRKEAGAFLSISEASATIGVAQHVLRHWESVFSQVRPTRGCGGRRLYRPKDIAVLRKIKALLHDDGHTTKSVQKLLSKRRAGREAPSFEGPSRAP